MNTTQIQIKPTTCHGGLTHLGADYCKVGRSQPPFSNGILWTALGVFVLGFAEHAIALPIEGIWNTHASMPTGRQQISAVGIGNRLYVIGGADMGGPSAALDIYDSSTNMWSSGASLGATQSLGTAVTIGGQLYYAGGCLFSDCTNTAEVLQNLQSYDPGTNTWSSLTASPTRHGGAPASAVINDKMYLVGGISTGFSVPATPNPALEIYDPIGDSWSTGANIPTPVEGGVAGAIDGKLYIAGGYDRGTGMTIDALQIYDPGTNMWSTGAPMPSERNFHTGGVIDGIFYVTGGTDDVGTVSDDLFAYDPVLDMWSSEPLMPTARRTLGSGVIGGSLFVVGGFDDLSWDALESFTPPAPIPEPSSLVLLALGCLGSWRRLLKV